MKIWVKTKEYGEGKFLVIRRDGTVFSHPHFVLGPRDPAAPAALRAYALAAQDHRMDPAYVDSIIELAADFEAHYKEHGDGSPDAAPHRRDDPRVLTVMRGYDAVVPLKHGVKKIGALPQEK